MDFLNRTIIELMEETFKAGAQARFFGCNQNLDSGEQEPIAMLMVRGKQLADRMEKAFEYIFQGKEVRISNAEELQNSAQSKHKTLMLDAVNALHALHDDDVSSAIGLCIYFLGHFSPDMLSKRGYLCVSKMDKIMQKIVKKMSLERMN